MPGVPSLGSMSSPSIVSPTAPGDALSSGYNNALGSLNKSMKLLQGSEPCIGSFGCFIKDSPNAWQLLTKVFCTKMGLRASKPRKRESPDLPDLVHTQVAPADACITMKLGQLLRRRSRLLLFSSVEIQDSQAPH